MPYNTEDYDGAVMSALAADSGVQAAAPYGVHWGVAEYGIDVPHIVVSVVSDTDDPDIGPTGFLSIAYLIRGVALNDRAAAAGALAAAHAVLHGRTLSVPGFVVIRRCGGSQRYADGDGFYNAAAYYRLEFTY